MVSFYISTPIISFEFSHQISQQIQMSYLFKYYIVTSIVITLLSNPSSVYASENDSSSASKTTLLKLGAGFGGGLFPFGVGSDSGGGSAGVGTRVREFESKISFPFEAQIIKRPLPFLGVGLCGYGNLNEEKSFFGIHIMLIIGKIRWKRMIRIS